MISRKNNLLTTCMLIFLIKTALTQENKQVKFNKVDLLNLSSQWSGYGTSVLYPETLKIMARKLNSQKGMMSTNTPLPGGVNWAINYQFDLKCKNNYNNASIGVFLSFNNPNMSVTDYNKAERSELFGYPQALDGLLIIYKNNELRVGMFMKPHLTENEVFNATKVCKEFKNKDNKIRVKVKYTDGSMVGIYTFDDKMNEKLCIQYTEVNRYQNFYLSVSGKDVEGECSSEMDALRFFTHEPIQIIPVKDKKKGDPFFSYFEKSKQSEHNKEWKKQQEMFKLHRNNSKIMASELLDFADYSQDDFYKKLKEQLNFQTISMEISLEVIEKEARAMQIFSKLVVDARKDTKKNIEDVFNEMIDFLEQVDSSYDEVEKSTLQIYNLASSIQLPEELTRIYTKTEKIANKLENFLFKKEKFHKESKIDSVRLEKVQKVQKFLGKLYRIEKGRKNQKIKKNGKVKQIKMKKIAKGKFLTIKNVGMVILGSIGGSILIGFLFMYVKIRKAIRHKQIL